MCGSGGVEWNEKTAAVSIFSMKSYILLVYLSFLIIYMGFRWGFTFCVSFFNILSICLRFLLLSSHTLTQVLLFDWIYGFYRRLAKCSASNIWWFWLLSIVCLIHSAIIFFFSPPPYHGLLGQIDLRVVWLSSTTKWAFMIYVWVYSFKSSVDEKEEEEKNVWVRVLLLL